MAGRSTYPLGAQERLQQLYQQVTSQAAAASDAEGIARLQPTHGLPHLALQQGMVSSTSGSVIPPRALPPTAASSSLGATGQMNLKTISNAYASLANFGSIHPPLGAASEHGPRLTAASPAAASSSAGSSSGGGGSSSRSVAPTGAPAAAFGSLPTTSPMLQQRHSVSSECMVGMDMIGDLFQQQAKRLEAMLCQQLRDMKQIELAQSQLNVTSQQLTKMQQQNDAQKQVIAQQEATLRQTYEQARAIESERQRIMQLCSHFAADIRTLRKTLAEQCPGRYEHLLSAPLEPLPASTVELPPLEGILPPPPPSEASASVEAETSAPAPNYLENHAETALALLSTVASDTQHGRKEENGSDSGDSGSNGNASSSNNGTEDTVSAESRDRDASSSRHDSESRSNGSEKGSMGSEKDSNGSDKDGSEKGSKGSNGSDHGDSNGSEKDSMGSEKDSNGSDKDSNGSDKDGSEAGSSHEERDLDADGNVSPSNGGNVSPSNGGSDDAELAGIAASASGPSFGDVEVEQDLDAPADGVLCGAKRKR